MICRSSWGSLLSSPITCIKYSILRSSKTGISAATSTSTGSQSSAAHKGQIILARAKSEGADMQNTTFDLVASEGTARAGRLTYRSGTVETPAILLYSRRGHPPHMTPDLLETLGEGAKSLIMDASHFLGNPTPATLAKAPGGGRGYLALKDAFLVASARDATVFNYPHKGNGSDNAIRIEAWAGSFSLSPERHQEVIQVLQPDLFVPLVDEVPAGANSRRVRKAIERTLRWLDAALASTNQNSPPSTALLAPIQGGSLPAHWRHSAHEASKRASTGYALCGLGTGETPEERQMCLEAALTELPAERPRLMVAGLTLDAILDAVAIGVDLFDGACVVQASLSGLALSLGSSAAAKNMPKGVGQTELDLSDTAYTSDTGPLVQGCQCFTCLNHTRAYVHHLIEVHEMSAMVLLELHNTHQVLQFMVRVRAAIRDGTFHQLRSMFLERRQPAVSCAVVN